MIYAFGPFELDPDLYALRRDGEPVKLAPKAFDVLLHLVRHRERVVPKAELLDVLWPGEHVTEGVLPANVNAIRKALGEGRGEPRFVQTVHGRGYRFAGELVERAPAAEEPAGDSDFVGREVQLAELGEALAASVGGRGTIVCLAGEPGIGKTRIAEELVRSAAARGVRALEGRCDEDTGAPAYWPWIQILRRLAAELDDGALAEALGAGAADLAHLVPEIGARLGGTPAPLALGSDEARFRLFDSVAGFLRGASRRCPLVLVLDDLHWADEPSLLLLRFLATQLADAPALVLALYRDVELRRTHPLARTLGELAHLPHLRRVTLRGLEPGDVARFIEAVGGASAPGTLVERVFQLTEGNPFFMQEMVRLLVAEGRLDGAIDETSLPQGVREAVGRRLDALDDSANDLLRRASVVGSEFGVAELAALAELSPDAILEALEGARAARLVHDAGLPPGRYAFTHVLIRETLYEELSTPERVRLHARVGEILEALRGATAEAHAEELAHHFFQAAPAGEVRRAIHWAVTAAGRARRLLAYEEAVLFYERALEVLPLAPPVDEAERCELLIGLGEAQRAAGRREAALQSLRTAADVARRIGRGDLLAQVAVVWPPTLGRQVHVWNAEYRPLVEEALEAVDGDALAVRAHLVSALAITPPDSDSMARRDVLSLEAVGLARRSGDDVALFRALEARLWALVGPDRQEERLAVATERLTLAQRAHSKEMEFDAREQRVRSLIALCRFADADAEIDHCDALAAVLRLPTYHLSVARFHLTRALGDGRIEEASALVETCTGWSAKIDDPDAQVMRVLWLVWLFEACGELDRLAPFLEEAVEQSEHWIGSGIRGFAAFIYASQGDLARARHHFRVATADLEALPLDEDWFIMVGIGSAVCAELEDRDTAARLYDMLRPYAELNVNHLHMRHYMGVGHLFLARLATVLGRDDDAREHFERALEQNAGLGIGYALACTRCHYGVWLSGRGRSASDRRRGRALLAETERTAREMGAKDLLARVARAAEGAWLRRRPETT